MLPLVSTVTYIWLMTVKDVTKFKILIIFTMILWAIYDFTIKSYTSCTFDVLTVIANIVSIIRINKGTKEVEENKEIENEN